MNHTSIRYEQRSFISGTLSLVVLSTPQFDLTIPSWNTRHFWLPSLQQRQHFSLQQKSLRSDILFRTAACVWSVIIFERKPLSVKHNGKNLKKKKNEVYIKTAVQVQGCPAKQTAVSGLLNANKQGFFRCPSSILNVLYRCDRYRKRRPFKEKHSHSHTDT